MSNDILYESENCVVCKGTYDGSIPVAIKILVNEVSYKTEMAIYEALHDNDPESHGIPKVYYHGNVFGVSSYKAIAMSLFDETVQQRYKNKTTDISTPFSDFSVLLIFKQAVI